MADPVVFKTGDPGAKNRDNWNELSARVQSVVNNADAVLGALEDVNDAAQGIAADKEAAEQAAQTATEKADLFTSQLATMSTQILTLQAIVVAHHGFEE